MNSKPFVPTESVFGDYYDEEDIAVYRQRAKMNCAMFTFLMMGLVAYSRARDRRIINQSAYMNPKNSAWRHLLLHGDEYSFLHITGFTKDAFFDLYNLVFPDKHRCGRRAKIWLVDQLGILLFYLGSKMQMKFLPMLFCTGLPHISKILKKILERVINVLSDDQRAKIALPDADGCKRLANLVYERERIFTDVIGFLDGLQLPIECCSEIVEQNSFYQPRCSDTTVNNVLAFSAEGKVIYAAINYPGSIGDGRLALPLLHFLIDNKFPYRFCVDSGFKRDNSSQGKFIGPLSYQARQKAKDKGDEIAIKRHIHLVSLRQASEWGNRSLQGTFPRLKCRLSRNKALRRMIILCSILLHNFRTDIVGLNQIKTVFEPEYEHYLNVSGYDRIKRYFQI